MLHNYFLIAWRNLKRNKLLAAINIFGLSIGLACCLLILLFIQFDFSYDRFHQDVDQIHRLKVNMIKGDAENEVQTFGYVQRGVGEVLKNDLPEVEAFIRIESYDQQVFQIGEEIFFEDAIVVDTGFFRFFSFPLKSGDPAEVLDKPESVVISEEKALKYFGTTDVVGRSINLLSREVLTPLTITAVAENAPQNSSIKFGIVLSRGLMDQLYRNGVEEYDLDWVSLSYTTLIRLSKGADATVVEEKLNGVVKKYGLEKIRKAKDIIGVQHSYTYHLQAFQDIHMDEEVASPGFQNMSSPLYSLILGGVGAFILLIALVNFINLSLAQSAKRFTEVGIRKVAGSRRRQLFVRFIGESMLLCLIAFVLAFILVQLVLPHSNVLTGLELRLSFLWDGYLISGYILLFIACTLLASFYPSLILSRIKPSTILSGAKNVGSKQYFTKSLLTVQFSFSIFLMIATIVLHSQFSFLLNKDLGYNDENLIEVKVPFKYSDLTTLFQNELQKNPAIISVAGGRVREGEGGGAFAVKYNGKQETVLNAYVDEKFLPTTGIQLLQGTNFQSGNSGGSEGIIVNEAFLKEFNIEKPLETVVTFPWEVDKNKEYGKRRIVGVIKDFHFGSLHKNVGPFMLQSSNNVSWLYIRLNPGQLSSGISFIEATFKKLIPQHPFEYRFMDDVNVRQYEKEARWKQIITYSSILTLFISCVGLFGLSRLTAEQRAKEISIRRVNGGKVSEILAMLNLEYLKWVLLAFFLASPFAWYALDRWLQHFAYRTEISWWIFALTALLTIGIALLTVSWQSWRAATKNPVESLRYE